MISLIALSAWAADGADGRGQDRITHSLGRASRPGGVAMLNFLGAKFRDVAREFGIVIAQLVELMLVMAVDLGLDRVGAGERGFLGHQGSCGSKCESGDVPQRL